MTTTVTTVAGNYTIGSGEGGYSGDGGPATLAQLSNPFGVAVDVKGNVYIADFFNHVIRMVNGVTGIITTVAGNHTQTKESFYGGYSGDGGPATLAKLGGPNGVAVDVQGNIYIADSIDNVIRMVNGVTGIITTVAGNYTIGLYYGGYGGDGGPATFAYLNCPNGVAVDLQGNIYIADTRNNVIRMVTKSTGIITTVAGNYTGGDFAWFGPSTSGGYSGDGGPATLAQLRQPESVALDVKGNLYIADPHNQVIRMVNGVTGIITTVAGDHTQTPGYYDGGYGGDKGPATSAKLSGPNGVAVDVQGNIYIADSYNQRIRMVTKSSGIITTLATLVSPPFGIAIDIEGHIYTANAYTETILMIALMAPTSMPTSAPTFIPTSMPTTAPTFTPTSMPTSAPTFNPTSLPASVCAMPPPPSPRTAKRCANLRKSTTQSKCKTQNAY